MLAAGACSFPERGAAVPAAYTAEALPLGIANVRFYADGDASPMVQEGQRSFEREQAALKAAGTSTTRLPPASYLAMSGGGDNGAFGALEITPITSVRNDSVSPNSTGTVSPSNESTILS